MAETDHLFNEVLKLRAEVEAIKHTTNVQVRFNKALKEAVTEQFHGDQALVSIFGAVNGIRSQKDIIKFLKVEDKSNAGKATVSRRLNTLRDLDLIEPVDKDGKSIIYRHTNFAKVINLSKLIRKLTKEK